MREHSHHVSLHGALCRNNSSFRADLQIQLHLFRLGSHFKHDVPVHSARFKDILLAWVQHWTSSIVGIVCLLENWNLFNAPCSPWTVHVHDKDHLHYAKWLLQCTYKLQQHSSKAHHLNCLGRLCYNLLRIVWMAMEWSHLKWSYFRSHDAFNCYKLSHFHILCLDFVLYPIPASIWWVYSEQGQIWQGSCHVLECLDPFSDQHNALGILREP